MGLALTRKRNQSIVLFQDGETLCRVTVVEIGDGKVKLGFEAPKDVTILREEIIDRTPTVGPDKNDNSINDDFVERVKAYLPE
jgi:carbon storage regulator CsrA